MNDDVKKVAAGVLLADVIKGGIDSVSGGGRAPAERVVVQQQSAPWWVGAVPPQQQQAQARTPADDVLLAKQVVAEKIATVCWNRDSGCALDVAREIHAERERELHEDPLQAWKDRLHGKYAEKLGRFGLGWAVDAVYEKQSAKLDVGSRTGLAKDADDFYKAVERDYVAAVRDKVFSEPRFWDDARLHDRAAGKDVAGVWGAFSEAECLEMSPVTKEFRFETMKAVAAAHGRSLPEWTLAAGDAECWSKTRGEPRFARKDGSGPSGASEDGFGVESVDVGEAMRKMFSGVSAQQPALGGIDVEAESLLAAELAKFNAGCEADGELVVIEADAIDADANMRMVDAFKEQMAENAEDGLSNRFQGGC